MFFSRFKQEKDETKLSISSISYDTASTTAIQATVQYEWSTDKAGNLKELEQKVTTDAQTIEAHYRAKKNSTTIERKPANKTKDKDDNPESKETLSGLRILKKR